MRDQFVADGLVQVFLQGRGDGHGGSSIAKGNPNIGRNSRRRLTMRAIANWLKVTPAGGPRQCDSAPGGPWPGSVFAGFSKAIEVLRYLFWTPKRGVPSPKLRRALAIPSTTSRGALYL